MVSAHNDNRERHPARLHTALQSHAVTTVHWLKCDTQPFEAVCNRLKLFELRINDRNYQAGDLLVLQEHDRFLDWPRGSYTGSWALVRVLYVFSGYVYIGETYGLQPGYAALSIDLLEHGREVSEHWPDASYDEWRAAQGGQQ